MAKPLDQAKRQEILRAAREKFAAKGYGQTSMGEIAREAGIAHGTVYLYFPSKDALTVALAADFYSRLAALVVPAAQGVESIEDVKDVVRLALAFIRRESDLVRMIYLHDQLNARPVRMPARLEFYHRLAVVFRSKIARGILRAYDPTAIAALVVGMVEWVGAAILTSGSGDIERLENTLLAVIGNALQPELIEGAE